MGRAAGAAAAVAVPEVAAARKIVPGMGRAEVTDELQRRRRDAATRSTARRSGAAQPATPPPLSPGDGTPAAPAPAPAGWSPSVPSVPAAVSTGSGFALGVLAWALGLAYLQGGPAGVKAWLAAKFLNKV